MFKTKYRKIEAIVKDEKIKYLEKFLEDENGNELFNRKIEMQNDVKLYDIYKSRKGLITSKNLKKYRNKYKLTTFECAKILSINSKIISKCENGFIQNDEINNILKSLADAKLILFLLEQNKYRFSNDRYYLIKNNVLSVIKKGDNKILNKQSTSVINIANKIIEIYQKQNKYLTHLKLQKLLFYVQKLSINLYGRKAFNEKIYAWSYGPVIKEIYIKYKKYNNKNIKDYEKVKLPSYILKIINIVNSIYGRYSIKYLVDLSHNEITWKNTKLNDEITFN